MPKPLDEFYNNCLFYEQSQCHRHAPQVSAPFPLYTSQWDPQLGRNSYFISGTLQGNNWPYVQTSDWCGEWKLFPQTNPQKEGYPL